MALLPHPHPSFLCISSIPPSLTGSKIISSGFSSPSTQPCCFSFHSLHLLSSKRIYLAVSLSTLFCSLLPFSLLLPLFDQVCSRCQTRRSLSERYSCVNQCIRVHGCVCVRARLQLLISACVVALCVYVCGFKHAQAAPRGSPPLSSPTISQRWMCLQGIGLRRKTPPSCSY